jgi:hypothetical protein
MRFEYRVIMALAGETSDLRQRDLCKRHSSVTLVGTSWIIKENGTLVINDAEREEGGRAFAVFGPGQWVMVQTTGVVEDSGEVDPVDRRTLITEFLEWAAANDHRLVSDGGTLLPQHYGDLIDGFFGVPEEQPVDLRREPPERSR